MAPGTVAESVEHGPRVLKIVGSDHGRVKPMTYKICDCYFLARWSDKDWLAQCQDNVTKWDITSWCWRPGYRMGQHYRSCHKSQVGTHPDMTLGIART